MRVCSVPGCPTLSERPTCAAHRRQSEAQRGSRQARGYGAEHEQQRRAWAPLVRAGGVRCRRCGRELDPGKAWELGHPDATSSAAIGPECVPCNRATRLADREAARRLPGMSE